MNDVKTAFKDLDEYINRQQKPLIIAIEGKCASGKTTLANMFINKYCVIHIDDFFLPPEKKTKDRLNEVGGNINYEAIFDMLEAIKDKMIIEYDKYDCHANAYSHMSMPYNDVIILEGVYSFHPYFNKFIDKLVFLETDEVEQRERINMRPNADMFYKVWMPLEERYYQESGVLKYVNLKIKKIN